ncbi:hypothetical protein SBA3_850037 [Candidatus Sulfopaludibacter sp. SbA3]|nr:hypothetical protein SBA3_850037 [Candidatus Sulfopaludibacter sp. SbA3]
MQPGQAVTDRWSGVAPFWEKYRGIIRQMFAPVTEALVEDGQIGIGHSRSASGTQFWILPRVPESRP